MAELAAASGHGSCQPSGSFMAVFLSLMGLVDLFTAVRALMGQLVRAVLRAIDAETGLLAWGQPVRRTDRSAPKVGSSLRLRGLAGSRAQSVSSFTGEVIEGGGASGEEEQECSDGAGDVGPVAAGPVGVGCCELVALNR